MSVMCVFPFVVGSFFAGSSGERDAPACWVRVFAVRPALLELPFREFLIGGPRRVEFGIELQIVGLPQVFLHHVVRLLTLIQDTLLLNDRCVRP